LGNIQYFYNFFKQISRIKLITSDRKDIYNVAKDFYCPMNAVLLNSLLIK